MGPSGAGKTTLLSLIAKKIDKQLTTSGHVNFFIVRSTQIIFNSLRHNFSGLEYLSIKMIFSMKLSQSDVNIKK